MSEFGNFHSAPIEGGARVKPGKRSGMNMDDHVVSVVSHGNDDDGEDYMSKLLMERRQQEQTQRFEELSSNMHGAHTPSAVSRSGTTEPRRELGGSGDGKGGGGGGGGMSESVEPASIPKFMEGAVNLSSTSLYAKMPTGHCDIFDIHMAVMRDSKQFSVSAEVEQWMKRVQMTAANVPDIRMNLIYMPNLENPGPFSPVTGFAACILDMRDNEEVPIFNPAMLRVDRFGYGHSAVRLPPPSEYAPSEAVYNLLDQPNTRAQVKDAFLKALQEEKISLRFPNSHIGVYKTVEEVESTTELVYYLVAAEGDRDVEQEYKDYISEQKEAGIGWKRAFHGNNSKIPEFQERCRKQRKKLLAYMWLLLGMPEERIEEETIIDVPHSNFYYNSASPSMIFASRCSFVQSVGVHMVAVSPMRGYVLLRGSPKESSEATISALWSGNEDSEFMFPNCTGTLRRPPQNQDKESGWTEILPLLVDTEDKTCFRKKNGYVYRSRDVNFRLTEQKLGRNPIMPENILAPHVVIISDKRGEDEEFNNSFFSTLEDIAE